MKLERLNLESSRQSWKVRAEVGQLSMTTFQFHLIFPTSARIFQLQRNFPTSAKLSNFKRSFPTSLGSFQLRSVLSNFAWFFPTKNLLNSLVHGDSQHSFTAVKFLHAELSLYTSYSACKLFMHAFYESIKNATFAFMI